MLSIMLGACKKLAWEGNSTGNRLKVRTYQVFASIILLMIRTNGKVQIDFTLMPGYA